MFVLSGPQDCVFSAGFQDPSGFLRRSWQGCWFLFSFGGGVLFVLYSRSFLQAPAVWVVKET